MSAMGANLHPILDMIMARTGVTLRVRQYCWLMGRLEVWIREFPAFANNEDWIVRAGVRFLEAKTESE